MTLYEFLGLTDLQQYQAVWHQGNHIDTLVHKDAIYLLYAMGNFYVEIMYSKDSHDILGKNQFKYGEHLEKYLPKLDLL
ncbi:hypothetical protein [Flavobacterium akiainvivens]|nr:hypothetical protein [Flavobacterium akiainvivens]SFQ39827.1 hypothetical protein SAMN05444144_1044 [Flavobacterium akiainvivens]